MTSAVIHQPRVAWDGARAFVHATYSAGYDAFADRVMDALGPALYDELSATHDRVLTHLVQSDGDQHVLNLETGKWRVRLEDLLRARPDLTDAVRELTAVAHR